VKYGNSDKGQVSGASVESYKLFLAPAYTEGTLLANTIYKIGVYSDAAKLDCIYVGNTANESKADVASKLLPLMQRKYPNV
jgi:hypothetical protein